MSNMNEQDMRENLSGLFDEQEYIQAVKELTEEEENEQN